MYGNLGLECHLSSIVQTTEGGFDLIGNIYSYTENIWLIKNDFEGCSEWNQTYGGKDWEYGTSMVE